MVSFQCKNSTIAELAKLVKKDQSRIGQKQVGAKWFVRGEAVTNNVFSSFCHHYHPNYHHYHQNYHHYHHYHHNYHHYHQNYHHYHPNYHHYHHNYHHYHQNYHCKHHLNGLFEEEPSCSQPDKSSVTIFSLFCYLYHQN